MLFLQLPNIDTEKLAEADSTVKAKLVNQIDAFSHMSPEEIIRTISSILIEVALKIALAIAIFYIGRWIIRRIKKLMTRVFERRRVDTSLRTFLLNLVSITLYILLIVITVDILGLNTTSFLALFASAGLAIGMALSGTLQNFAGGVMVLLLKPFRVGDYIEAQGQAGTVKSIQLFNTVITTPDNKTILIPNGPISTGIINNYSRQATRRVEWVIGVNYGDDFEVARAAIKGLIDKDERILRDPASQIEILALAESSVNIVVRVWVKSPDFWQVFFDMNSRFYKTLPEKGIRFPFPQMDVHITQ